MAWITFPTGTCSSIVLRKADELMMAMALHVATDDSAVKDVEGCEQRGGAVTFVVVRHRPGTARLHRQTRLGAVERLDLALLVDREDDRMGGGIDVRADDVFEFLGGLRRGPKGRGPAPRAFAARCDPRRSPQVDGGPLG